VPITGTQRVTYLEQSVAAAGFTLSTLDSAELEAIFTPDTRAGERYPRAMLAGLGI
jgi:aryl-alcohol dehydrogenase-like predicted oxidoreductase